jgi:dephospho-CoA kinase
VEAFGQQVVAADGTIDRKRLASIVFADPEALRRLNAITHPRIREMIQEGLAELAAQGTEVVVVEAALLLEAGWDDLVDEVWVTVAPPEVAAQRAAARSGIPLEEALARVRAQMSNDTECSLEETCQQVHQEWERLQARLHVEGR